MIRHTTTTSPRQSSGIINQISSGSPASPSSAMTDPCVRRSSSLMVIRVRPSLYGQLLDRYPHNQIDILHSTADIAAAAVGNRVGGALRVSLLLASTRQPTDHPMRQYLHRTGLSLIWAVPHSANSKLADQRSTRSAYCPFTVPLAGEYRNAVQYEQ